MIDNRERKGTRCVATCMEVGCLKQIHYNGLRQREAIVLHSAQNGRGQTLGSKDNDRRAVSQSILLPVPQGFEWGNISRRESNLQVRNRDGEVGRGEMIPRTELPWSIITSEVARAVTDSNNGKRFVRVKHVADYILSSRDIYKHMSGEKRDVVIARVGKSMKKMDWPRFTNSGSRSAVYIDPRVEA